MDFIEQEGRSVEDAIERGLATLGLTRDQVEIEVLAEGGRGLLGILGGKQAKVLIRRREGTEQRIQRVVEDLMRPMDFSTQISVSHSEGLFFVDIETAGLDGLLIGRRGRTLQALQYLVGRIVNKGSEDRVRVVVDVGGYCKRRDEALRKRAVSLADSVRATGRQVSTEPLRPPDRRVIHRALMDDPAVKTYAVGDGTYKSVVIAPADAAEATGRGAEVEVNCAEDSYRTGESA